MEEDRLKELADLKTKFSEHLKEINKSLKHPKNRQDILLNSICGGGLFIIFNFVKDADITILKENIILVLIISAIGLVSAIIFNFLRFLLKDIENEFLLKIGNQMKTHLENYNNKGKNEEFDYRKGLDFKIKLLSFLTPFFNVIAIISMLSGVILLAIFFVNYIYSIYPN